MAKDTRCGDVLERLFRDGTLNGVDEGDLLGRFADHGDEAAFEAIVERHGPIVLGVCRRMLRDQDDAEDAFQATFLVLVRKARSLRDRKALSPWLHGVARRVCSRARKVAARRARHLPVTDLVECNADRTRPDPALGSLDEEIDRLPTSFRGPIILCHLEGCSYDEAARRLRCTEGMVRGRLARGRARLRERLVARGFSPELVEGERPAPMMPSAALTLAAVKLAAFRSGPGHVPVAVAYLAGGLLRPMNASRSMVFVSGILLVGLVVSSAVGQRPQDVPSQKPPAALPQQALNSEEPPELVAARKALKEWWATLETLSFREEEFHLKADGRRDSAREFARLDFALAPGHRFAYEMRSFSASPYGPQSLILLKRWDGRRFYQGFPEGRESSAVGRIEDKIRRGPLGRYDGEMSHVLWLIMPTGDRLVGTHPFGNARLELELQPQGRRRIVLVDDRHSEARLELDPDHGWMPCRMKTFGGGTITVTRFRMEAGHWFPTEGKIETPAGKGPSFVDGFEVKDLRINQHIPRSAFNLDDFQGIPVEREPD